MNVLLSIKPEFADRILTGEKQYEFRKSSFRDPDQIDNIIMYSSSPVQRIVGIFTISEVYEQHPETLWENYGSESGIGTKERFLRYFDGKESGFAMEIEQVHKLGEPIDPTLHIEGFRPPVSFQYVNGEFDFLMENFVSDTFLIESPKKINQYS